MVKVKIEKAVIGIAGAGGLGSNLAISLARIGFKNFHIADFDLVEESNLNRQYYFRKDLGSLKVDALKENMESVVDDLKVNIYSEKIDSKNIARIFSKVDLMVEALDDPKEKAMLVEEFRKRWDKPIIAASGIGGFKSSNSIKTRKISRNFYLVGDEDRTDEEEELFLAPRVIIAANHQANMVLRLIMNKEEA